MIYQILQNGLSFGQNVILLITTLVTVFLSLTLHEFAHGLVSYMQGDDTAKRAGRLTLNPMKHIDPIGAICMVFAGFGWAKPVPVDARYYKKPKKGMALTGIAGPLINLIIGISTTVLLTALNWLWGTGLYRGFPLLRNMSEDNYITLFFVMYIVLYYNLLFAVFNMLPIPPFDGSRLLFAFLPDKYYFGVMKYEKLIMLAVFLMLWGGMFTGVFEAVVSAIITVTERAVFFVLEGITALILKI